MRRFWRWYTASRVVLVVAWLGLVYVALFGTDWYCRAMVAVGLLVGMVYAVTGNMTTRLLKEQGDIIHALRAGDDTNGTDGTDGFGTWLAGQSSEQLDYTRKKVTEMVEVIDILRRTSG